MATRKKRTTRKKRWSQRVTEGSDALTLDVGVFSRDDPRSIARSLKRSADRSRRRKSDPYRSAMSMLTFYLNRAGKNLPATRRRKVEAAKRELRSLYGKDAPAGLGVNGAKRRKSNKKKTATTRSSSKRSARSSSKRTARSSSQR